MTMGYRPTQAEVEAMAAAMFGADWKRLPQHQQAVLDGVIARRLDAARARVVQGLSAQETADYIREYVEASDD